VQNVLHLSIQQCTSSCWPPCLIRELTVMLTLSAKRPNRLYCTDIVLEVIPKPLNFAISALKTQFFIGFGIGSSIFISYIFIVYQIIKLNSLITPQMLWSERIGSSVPYLRDNSADHKSKSIYVAKGDSSPQIVPARCPIIPNE